MTDTSPLRSTTGQHEHQHGSSVTEPRIDVHLLGSFALLLDGAPVDLPVSVQRLVALLALENRPIGRRQLAGVLWPEKSETRAAANLRSTLWRLNSVVEGVVTADHGSMALTTDVSVDVHRLLPGPGADRRSPFLSSSTAAVLAHPPTQVELLADWYDEWVVVEREHIRQQTLRALETAAAELARIGLHAEALDAGTAAVRLAPLRETAHRAVIGVHLAEGNYAEAVRQYEAFAAVLFDAFGVAPSEHLTTLLTTTPAASDRIARAG